MKRLLSVILALALLLSCTAVFAETAAEPDAGEAARQLLVTVNGTEIWSDDAYLKNFQDYFSQMLQSYGYDLSDEQNALLVNQFALENSILHRVLLDKAKELGADQISDERLAEIREETAATWAQALESYETSELGITADSSEEDKTAARADALAYYESLGYTEESLLAEQIESEVVSRLQALVTEGIAVTDAEIQAEFDSRVAADKENYGNNIPYYEFARQYGQTSLYTPEGYRGVIHILLQVDEALLNNYKDLSARFEEQQQAEEATPTSLEDGAETDETSAEAESAEAPAEPVTQEMVDEAEKAVLASVQSTVDEIMQKYEAGTSFPDLIAEYGTDPGMQDPDRVASGYEVHAESASYDPAFQAAAMALEKVGDVSKPIVGSYGVHILQYLRDIPAGAVELTDALREEIGAELLDSMKQDAFSAELEKWRAEAKIEYTEAGEAWQLPEGQE